MYPTISCTKMMTGFQRYCLLSIYFLFFFQLFPSTTALSRSRVKIKSTNQSIKLVDMFAFEKRGGVDLWVSDITFSSSSDSEPIITPNLHDLSQMGFYLSPRGIKGAELLKEHDKDKSLCYLHSDIGGSKKIIYTLDKLEGANQFNISEELEIEPGYYSLLLENCVPNVEVSMVFGSGLYDLDGNGSRHYSNWGTNIGFRILYPIFLFLYVVVVWRCFDGDSTHILQESCIFSDCFYLKMTLVLGNIGYVLIIDFTGFPVAFHRWLMNTLINSSMMKMMLYLQSGAAVRTPPELRVQEVEWGIVGCFAMVILSAWETYSSLQPCDAYSMGCFLGLNATRCAHYCAVILMLYMVWKDSTDDACVKLTKSLTVPRSNLFFFTLLSYFGALHLSLLLTMFPSTSAVAIALEELANLALFLSIYYLYLPPPSAHVADDDLEAPLINSQP